MATEKKEATRKKKPNFFRKDWHKRIKLGRGVKKNQKWRGAKGRQNKIRLGIRGHSARPKVGWGNESASKDFVSGIEAVRVENLNDLKSVKSGHGIIIANVGKKKRNEIVKIANEKKIKILNRYKEKK